MIQELAATGEGAAALIPVGDLNWKSTATTVLGLCNSPSLTGGLITFTHFAHALFEPF